MSKNKKITSRMYLKENIVWDRKERRYYYDSLPDGKLYSLTKHGYFRKTSITKEDLPEYFIFGRFYKRWGYIDVKNIKYIKYRPIKMLENHVFKDDFLLISYDKPITQTDENGIDGYSYDVSVCGNELISVINGMVKYAGYDATEIKEELWNKILTLKDVKTCKDGISYYDEIEMSREKFDSWFKDGDVNERKANNQKKYQNIFLLSDTSGTGWWRIIQKINAMNCIANDIGVLNTYTQVPILDRNYYKNVNSITVQRWISPEQCNLFTKFFKPLMDSVSGWTFYEIDDNMSEKYIPLFNRGRLPFSKPQNQQAIRTMLNSSDFVTVTTHEIKKFYNEYYGVPEENIICVPNLLPRSWIDDYYDPDKKLAQFSKYKNKMRVAFISSLSHYNIDNIHEQISTGQAVRPIKENGKIVKWLNDEDKEVSQDDMKPIKDDLEEYIELIRKTVNEFQWVFAGYCPPQLEDLAKSGKIEVHRGVQILNYPSMVNRLQAQAVIAPISDMKFNECKSPIKYLECSALGIPLFASRLKPYTTCMKDAMLFDNAIELYEKLKKLKFSSGHIYKSIIEYNWNYINTPHQDGDFNLKNYWLEDNLGIHIDLAKMKQKMLPISLRSVYEQIKARRQKEKEETLHTSESGQATIML